MSRRVHWTRAIHIADGLLEDQVNGTPRLEKVWNRLDDLDKVVGGGSEAFWLRVNQGFHWNIDKDVKITPEQVKKLEAEAEEFAHQLRRTMATRGMKLDVKGSDVSTFNNQVMSIISLISGATGIPQRILLGSERGELASTQDKENWNERVAARRGEFGEPVIRQFVSRLTDRGALPKPEKYDVRWPEIQTLTQEEQAGVAQTWAGLNTSAGDTVVTAAEIRDRVLRLDPLDAEQMDEEAATATIPPEGAVPAVPGAEPGAAPVPTDVPPPLNLNGAQIQAAVDIVRAVSAGELPKDSGISLLENLFGLSHVQAVQMVGTAGDETKPPAALEPTT
jgi:hypothetical protein